MVLDGARRRLAARLRWRWQRHRLAVDAATLRADARALGFPPPPPVDRADPLGAAVSAAAPPPAPAHPSGAAGSVAAATVCTVDHLHFALALAASLRRHHPEISLHVLVVDGDGVDLPVVAGCHFVSGSAVGLFDDRYLALKYSAVDLCCAAKPFLVAHVAATAGCRTILYLDADFYLFAPLTRLLEDARDADFVVFPHTVAPMPRPDLGRERPTLGQLALAGVFNAGLFALRVEASALRFIATWRGLVTEPGAFLATRGAQSEQNSFNWVVAFADSVHVMRDNAYNVAYWNLHERALRWSTTTSDGPAFTVDGSPLVAFHFSGFRPDEPSRLSLGDHRHSVSCDRALARLLSFYAAELAAHGQAQWSDRPYRFARFPSGVAIDRRMRELFNEFEPELRREVDPFSPAGEALYCRALLSPLPGAASLLPLLLAAIYRQRPDLRAFAPDADLEPEKLLRWFSTSGVAELDYRELFDRHRPVVPRCERLRELANLREALPRLLSAEEQPLGRGRPALVAGLAAAGHGELARAVGELATEIYAASPVFVVWRLVRERPDLRASYPNLLDTDAEAFAAWLRIFGTRVELLDRDVPERFAACARGGSLARIFSFLDRQTALAEAWPLALAGEDAAGFARLLLEQLAGSPEYDLDDVVMYLWVMAERPWTGLPLVLELRANGRRQPSPLLEEGQEALLAPLLAARGEFRRALDDYRRRVGALPVTEAAHLRAPHTAPEIRARRPGVNLFAPFRSPNGPGCLARGLAGALRHAGEEVRQNLLGHPAMGAGLEMEEFVRHFDFGLDTNLFVSSPHLVEPLAESQPPAVVASRRNVAYLVWEQREANPLWAAALRDFDQVWTPSAFAAQGLAAALDREVLVVPGAVDLSGQPHGGTPRSGGETFTFLSTLDADGSLERKNPEGVVAAFARAFRRGEQVRLWLRIANAHRWTYRRRLSRLAGQAAATGLDIRFFPQPMTRAAYLALLADADAYVALHRAEAFGLACAEAMAMGKPTIATGYSGNLDFMDSGNALLVECREVEVRTADGPFRGGSLWAEPSLEHAATQMRWVYDRPADARALGERARTAVLERCSPAAVGGVATAALRRLR